MTTSLLLAAAEGLPPPSAIRPFLPARLEYRLSPELRLLRSGENSSAREGILVLSDAPCNAGNSSLSQLCRQLISECHVRQFIGIAADFTLPTQEPLRRLCRELSPLLKKENLLFFVSPQYAEEAPEAYVLLPCHVRSGSLRAFLEDLRLRYGERATLDLSRMYHDFPLSGGESIPLDPDALRLLRVRYRPMSFYSRELLSNYFTYRANDGLHFVLYDEANTLLQKILLADSLGFSHVFLLYPEVKDLLPRLLRDLNRSDTIKAR